MYIISFCRNGIGLTPQTIVRGLFFFTRKSVFIFRFYSSLSGQVHYIFRDACGKSPTAARSDRNYSANELQRELRRRRRPIKTSGAGRLREFFSGFFFYSPQNQKQYNNTGRSARRGALCIAVVMRTE